MELVINQQESSEHGHVRFPFFILKFWFLFKHQLYLGDDHSRKAHMEQGMTLPLSEYSFRPWVTYFRLRLRCVFSILILPPSQMIWLLVFKNKTFTGESFKITDYSPGGPEFHSQPPHGKSQHPVSRYLSPLWPPWAPVIHADKNVHTYIIKIKVKRELPSSLSFLSFSL